MGKQEDLALQIRIELLKKGVTQQRIADELNITKGTVSLFIDGKRTSKRFSDWIRKNLKIHI
jgi:predicted transcriptional regulator